MAITLYFLLIFSQFSFNIIIIEEQEIYLQEKFNIIISI